VAKKSRENDDVLGTTCSETRAQERKPIGRGQRIWIGRTINIKGGVVGWGTRVFKAEKGDCPRKRRGGDMSKKGDK